MVDVSTVSIAIASAGVLAGVIYYVLEIRHQSRLRRTESVIRLSPWFNMNAREVQEAVTQVCSIEYKNYEDYLERYSEKPEHMTLKILGNYFEGIGILVDRKLVEIDMRKDIGDPHMFRFWEYLYNEMKKR
jgi:hypothetical protein